MCASNVSSRCESPAAISDQSRDGRAMAGGVLRSATAAGLPKEINDIEGENQETIGDFCD